LGKTNEGGHAEKVNGEMRDAGLTFFRSLERKSGLGGRVVKGKMISEKKDVLPHP